MSTRKSPIVNCVILSLAALGALFSGSPICRAEEAKADPEPAKVFASPQEVVDAYRTAHAKKDWRTCFQCQTPELRGIWLRECFFAARIGNQHVVNVFEKHFKVPFFAAGQRDLLSKPMETLLEASCKIVDGKQEIDPVLLYNTLDKNVDDVSKFIADCFREGDGFPDFGEVFNIVVKGDRAVGELEPFPQNLPPVAPIPLKDRLRSLHFQKIGESWFLGEVKFNQ